LNFKGCEVKVTRKAKVLSSRSAAKATFALNCALNTWRIAEQCQQFELHSTRIIEWKKQLLSNASGVFGSAAKVKDPVDLGPLHARIGQQALEIDFLSGALTKAGLLSADK
jgi:transposase